MATAPKVHRAYTERQRRGTTTERGYGADWQRLREYWICRHPLCVECLKKGLVVAYTYHTDKDGKRKAVRNHVHHIIPHRNNKALKLDPNNLETLCEACHMKHHKRPNKR